MKLKTLSLLVMAAVGTPLAAMAAEPPYSISGNLTLASDYAFRGVSQTVNAPAVQGGFDFNHKSGFYLGTWASNVSEYEYNGNMEWDIYGGYSFDAGPVNINVGGLYYWYPNGGANNFDPDTFEVYAGATWKFINVKASYSTTDYFGLNNSDGTVYYEVNLNHTLPYDINISAHHGWTEVENYSGTADYRDWKVGVSKEFFGFNFGLAYVDTNLPTFKIKGDDITKGRVIVSVGKTF